MTCIVHLSDLHFGRDLPPVSAGLLTCLQAIQPDLIIVSGDLTQRARHREFNKAAAFLQQLPAPRLVVPGNHDISLHNPTERFFYPWEKWRQYISAELEPWVEQPDCIVQGINTVRRMGLYRDWSRGRINQQQIQKVQQTLTNVTGTRLRIVVAHHPFWLPPASLSRSLTSGSEIALPAFRQAGVDLILGGHIHLTYARAVQGMIVAHAGSGTSHRLPEGHFNSFNVVRGDRQQLYIEQWQWQGAAFGHSHSVSFQRTQQREQQKYWQ